MDTGAHTWTKLKSGSRRLGTNCEDHPPATPKLEELPLKEDVSQYGISWTFDKPTRVGQFINGAGYAADRRLEEAAR